MTHWSFNFAGWFLLVTLVAWALSAAASWQQWKRRGKRVGVLLMEILRMAVVTLICVMLFRRGIVGEIQRRFEIFTRAV